MKIALYFSLFIVVTLLHSCIEKNTISPAETYSLWAGQKPSSEIKIIHGKYWQSAHWSKEYEMYLELEASSLWRAQFIKENNLVETKAVYDIPSDAPDWFKPNSSYRILTKPGDPQPTYYYEDTIMGKLFLYEIQY